MKAINLNAFADWPGPNSLKFTNSVMIYSDSKLLNSCIFFCFHLKILFQYFNFKAMIFISD